jgi:hypothetical protein
MRLVLRSFSKKIQHLGSLLFAGMFLGLASLNFVRRVPQFQIFSEQEVKNSEKANSLKIFSTTVSGKQQVTKKTNSFINPNSSFVRFVQCNFLWSIFF